MHQSTIEQVFRSESRRALATLIRLLGDFDLAEEALQDAFGAALEQWPSEGMPSNPRAWLVSTGRFKAIDGLRRRARFESIEDHLEHIESIPSPDPSASDEAPEDDRLRLLFTCCHPSLATDAQVALALREICGLTTEAIAHAYLQSAPTIAQRIVRAKAKIRDARIPYEVPSPDELPARLAAVLRVVYLLFNEGYKASAGEGLFRLDVASEAIRLGRLLQLLLPCGEVSGLLALMLLHDARRDARVNAQGEIVLLHEQDRSLWHRDQIQEGLALVPQALKSRPLSTYAVQAAIAALHAQAADADATDWAQIIALYDVALGIDAEHPVVALNRAVAMSMTAGPQSGLDAIDALMHHPGLRDYHLLYAARADMQRRLGCGDEARESYRRALSLTTLDAERRFLIRRLDES